MIDVCSLVPTTAPSDLLSKILVYTMPFHYRFSWSINQPNSIGQSMIHTGFTLNCSIDQADQSVSFVTTGQSIFTHSIFTSTVQDSYSAEIFMPTNCGLNILYYLCSVSAFNGEGEGPKSEAIPVYLPCDFNSECSTSGWGTCLFIYWSTQLLGTVDADT